MSTIDLDNKINSFLSRKETEFPELALMGHEGNRTVKYAQKRYVLPQLSFGR